MSRKRRSCCLMLPVMLIERAVASVLNLVRRGLTIALGLIFIGAGVLVSFTVVGLVAGIPLAAFGVLLLIRGIF